MNSQTVVKPMSRSTALLRRRLWMVVTLLLLFVTAAVQGQQQQPIERDGFRLAVPGYEFQFPADHGSHDAYRTEWWYYTGQVRSESGKRYGFEVTFFRVGVMPAAAAGKGAWDLRNLALAHFAITDIGRKEFRYYEKLNRSTKFTANAATGMLDVFNESWRATTQPDGSWRLVASAGGDSIDLVLRTRKAPVVHGQNGVSVKAEGLGYASHYYSMTRLEVSGTIAIRSGTKERCSGLAWMDHEFGSSVLRENQQGWDWFSIHLDEETELMLYQIRTRDGGADKTSSGTFVGSDGTLIHLTSAQFSIQPLGRWKSPKSGAVYPMGWRVTVPSLDIALQVSPVMENQELVTSGSTGVTYWEGAVDVNGSSGNTAVRGAGYVEMTGYDKPFTAQ